jgi:hypothetical protein
LHDHSKFNMISGNAITNSNRGVHLH